MRILCTGGGGFIGNVLCRSLLKRGYQVRCMDNFWNRHCDQIIELTTDENFEFMYGDVSNKKDVEKALIGVDKVVHLAALVGFPMCEKFHSLAYTVNVEGTKNIVDLKGDIPLIYSSTGSNYGAIEDICTEDTPCNPLTQYGKTKLAAENIVSEAPNSLSFRFATGFGVSPHMRVNLLVNDLVYQAINNRAINVFQADFRRTFIHVSDMSRAFIFALENIHNLKHKVYNCGDNKLNWTKRELADYIKSKTGCYVSYGESGKDLDQRDYEVSYDRLNSEGFYCNHTMEQGINELIKATPLLQITHQYV